MCQPDHYGGIIGACTAPVTRPQLPRENLTTARRYPLRGLQFCELCNRRMQGNYNGTPYYRCRWPDRFAVANHIHHLRTIYLRQNAIIPKPDTWLPTAFAPHKLPATAQATAAAIVDADANADERCTTATYAEREQLDTCNLELTRYRARLDVGTDPAIVAGWIREVHAERLAIQARLRTATRRATATTDDITAIAAALSDMLDVLARAEPANNNQDLRVSTDGPQYVPSFPDHKVRRTRPA